MLGEANFSDHGANRLGASALMQGLADGYFVIPIYRRRPLSGEIRTGPIETKTAEFDEAEKAVRSASTTSSQQRHQAGGPLPQALRAR
jgi:succinate dehydrogenase / fumarate reductase flavoprotein subunit